MQPAGNTAAFTGTTKNNKIIDMVTNATTVLYLILLDLLFGKVFCYRLQLVVSHCGNRNLSV